MITIRLKRRGKGRERGWKDYREGAKLVYAPAKIYITLIFLFFYFKAEEEGEGEGEGWKDLREGARLVHAPPKKTYLQFF